MDKYIIANINMFDRASPVFIVAPNEDIVQLGAYTVEELPDAIINQAYENEIYDNLFLNKEINSFSFLIISFIALKYL